MKKERKNYFLVGLKYLLSNNIFKLTIALVTLFLVAVVVYKAINSKQQIEEFEVVKTKIEQKQETELVIDYPQEENKSQTTGAVAITNCLKTPIKKEDLSQELLNISNQIESTMNESNYNFAFKYKDLYTGFSLAYNSNQPIYAASTIKAPEAIYIYEQAEKGNANLNDTLTYTSNYYSNGTGILKNTKFNVNYTIRDLVGYSIIHSDNAAHMMLNNKYKSENIYNYWTEKGTTSIYKDKTAWGNLTADDGTIYMEELYNYYLTNTENSKELLNYFKKSWKVISAPNNITIASKSGWADNSLHDVALIFDDNPYTLVILSNRGYTEYQDFFNKISNLTYEFHQQYWKEKINICTK